jgi:hypothetical protein
MAKRFLTPPKILNLSSDPMSGSSGEIYFNSEDSVVKVYDGESWIQIGQGGSSGGAAYQPEEPDSPSIGDLWVESDEEYTTINPNDYALKTTLENNIDKIISDYTQMLFLGGM